jgi:putative membrane protein
MQKLAIFLLSVCMAGFAQNADQGSTAKKAKSKAGGSSDAQFAMKAAQGNMAEVALGQLATQKAQSDDVKKFGQRMTDDHQKAEQDLEGVASKANLTLPKEPNAQQKAEQQRLEKLSGAAFDRAYMQMMVKDHTKDVAEFKKEANSTAANSDLRDYAKRTYPTLDDHLTNAKAVSDSLTKSGANTGKGSGKKSTKSSVSGTAGLLMV